MQENFSSKSNNNDEQQHIDPEQNEQQQSASEQEEQIKDTPQEQPSAPSEGDHLPAWLRAEMGSSPEPQEQQSTEQKPEASSAEREVQQLREQVRGYQHQLASVQRQVHRLEEDTNYQAAPERGGCLTAWLLLLFAGSILVMLLGFITLGTGIPGLLLLGWGILVFAGVWGIWQLKKWGYYLVMTLQGIGIVYSILSLCSNGGASSGGSLGGSILGMLILYLLVREKWSAFE
ncbi:MAG: hypothetical protein J2P37_29790 [Ktedonobacteraceae bacterium]|nr:hypothetical protein [Ktedonobacteraceae bacterium]